MKNIFTLLILAVTVLHLSAQETSKSLNTDRSIVNWEGHKVLGSHSGTIKFSQGELTFQDDVLTGGSLEIDMTTMECTDLEGEKGANLVGHLMSEDFFGVETHPTANYVITRVISRGKEGDYKLKGDLTIKGITKEYALNVILMGPKSGGELVIDRTDFDIKYGSGSFFDDLGDKTIYDEFDLRITLLLNE